MADPDRYFEAVGAVHLHSDFSDGSLPIPEIARIAADKQLDFLMFSDHHTLEPKRQGLEGWFGPVLVLIGYEINDPDDRNHYLAFGLDEEVGDGLKAAEYVRRVRDKGGFGVIAHPAEKRNFSEAYPPYPWTDWEVDGFDGIEIWNQLSEWMEGVTRSNIGWRIWHPLRSIRFPVWETLERWDRLNRSRRVVGIGGIDVHAFQIKVLGLFPVEIYPYKVQFRSIRTHVLTAKPIRSDTGQKAVFGEAESLIYDALRSGRCFITNSSIGDGRGFRFFASSGPDRYEMGSRIRKGLQIRFTVHIPLEGQIRLLRDGQVAAETHGRQLEFRAQTQGVYRVEIFRKRRGWIYSNPIVIEEKARGQSFPS